MNDPDPLARQTLRLIDKLRMTVHPRTTAYLGSIAGPIVVAALAVLAQRFDGRGAAVLNLLAAIAAILVISQWAPAVSTIARVVVLTPIVVFVIDWFALIGALLFGAARTPEEALRDLNGNANRTRLVTSLAAVP